MPNDQAPQWTVQIGRVSKEQERTACGLANEATGSVYGANGDRICGRVPGAYRVRFTCPGHDTTERYLCTSCAAAAAHRYGHPFPPGPWVDVKPPLIVRPP